MSGVTLKGFEERFFFLALCLSSSLFLASFSSFSLSFSFFFRSFNSLLESLAKGGHMRWESGCVGRGGGENMYMKND